MHIIASSPDGYPVNNGPVHKTFRSDVCIGSKSLHLESILQYDMDFVEAMAKPENKPAAENGQASEKPMPRNDVDKKNLKT